MGNHAMPVQSVCCGVPVCLRSLALGPALASAAAGSCGAPKRLVRRGAEAILIGGGGATRWQDGVAGPGSECGHCSKIGGSIHFGDEAAI